MPSNREAFDHVKEQLKAHLKPYLSYNHSRPPNAKGLFSCINPDHPDHNPSCGLVPQSSDTIFHCFSCGVVGDIFDAAHFLESKPISGPGFITDNLMYLASLFGVAMPDTNFSEEELKEMEEYRAYSHAASIIRTSELNSIVDARLIDYAWPVQETRPRLGYGSVKSYEDYLGRMTKQYGHRLDFLRKVDLARPDLFNENNLIFTVKDEHGSPVGFAARDLLHKQHIEAYDQERAKIAEKEGSDSPRIKNLRKPAKFINTSGSCSIYKKGTRLYNFDLAKKSAPPLWVVEGYGDATTLFAGGLKNTCAIGAIWFSEEHLELVLSSGIKHLIFVLDADKAGTKGTDRFVELLSKCLGGHIGLRTEIVVMPEGTDDPDAFVHKYPTLTEGVTAFRNLPRVDLFSYDMHRKVAEGVDPLTVAEEKIPLIVNEQNNLTRLDRTRKLAQATGLDEGFLRREVMRLIDVDGLRIEEEKTQITKRLTTALAKEPRKVEVLLEAARGQLDSLERRRRGYDVRNAVEDAHRFFERSENSKEEIELFTGYRFLDKAIGGLPKREAFITLPGKPNHNKSTFLDNLCMRLPLLNRNCMVLFHTVDDPFSARVARLLGARQNHPTNWFKKAGFYCANVEGFEDSYKESQQWLLQMFEEERIIIADVSRLPGSLPALEGYLQTIRSKFPERDLITMCDNFALYDLPGFDPGENKIRESSMFFKRLSTMYSTTILATCELPKDSLRPGVRPRVGRIKGSSGMAYDSSCNLGIYTDMKDLGDKSVMTWQDNKDQEAAPGIGGEAIMTPKTKPILEVVIDKSKLSAFDGTIYYKVWPDSGHIEECSESEQAAYRSVAPDQNVQYQGVHSQAPFRGL